MEVVGLNLEMYVKETIVDTEWKQEQADNICHTHQPLNQSRIVAPKQRESFKEKREAVDTDLGIKRTRINIEPKEEFNRRKEKSHINELTVTNLNASDRPIGL